MDDSLAFEVLDRLPEGVLILDQEKVVCFANQSVKEIWGVKNANWIGCNYEDLKRDLELRGGRLVDENFNQFLDQDPIEKSAEELIEVENLLVNLLFDDSTEICIRLNSKIIHHMGSFYAAVTLRDISIQSSYRRALQDLTQRLMRERNFLRVLLNNLHEGIVSVDHTGKFNIFNKMSLEMHAIDNPDEMIGKEPSGSDLYFEDGRSVGKDANPLIRALHEMRHIEKDLIIKNRLGKRFDVRVSAEPLYDDKGEILGAVVAMLDVTQQKKAESALREMATTDSLTGLLNRVGFFSRLEEVVKYAQRTKKNLALYMMDVNKFKFINDNYGHLIGDEVLVQIGKQLLSSLRPLDLAARLGGDEFCVITAVATDNEALKLKNRLKELTTVKIPGSNKLTTCAVGLSISSPSDDKDRNEMIKEADDAMYVDKQKSES